MQRSKSAEIVLKAGWHVMIAGVGLYEYRHNKTRFSKFLSVCLMAFHVDASICDWLDVPTTPQRFFKKVLDKRA